MDIRVHTHIKRVMLIKEIIIVIINNKTGKQDTNVKNIKRRRKNFGNIETSVLPLQSKETYFLREM